MSASTAPVERPVEAEVARARVLVAGIGNIFFGDDAFGVEVVRQMAERGAGVEGVKVTDFGIRSLHLAYELLEGYDVLLLVDAVPLGEAPGTVVLFEPEAAMAPAAVDGEEPIVDAHSMSPAVVLGTLAALGGSVSRVLVVGCQPAVLDQGIGLSDVVEAAVGPALDLIDGVLADLLSPDERSEEPT